MVIRAARQADPPSDAQVGISAETLTTWRERAVRWQRRDLNRALASFTFIADVTVLAEDCCFAGDVNTLVARYDGLPFTAIAFYHRTPSNPQDATRLLSNDDVSERVADLTRCLVAPGEAFICLVDENDWPLLRAAYHVLKLYLEWQMSFCADPLRLDPGEAVPLRPSDVPEMRALARQERMQAFDHNPLRRGPWYGIWRHGGLIAQGGTHLIMDQAAEIGNIVTARGYRRQGYGSQVVAALLRELSVGECSVFLHVLKENEAAIALYEHLGFKRLRTMILAQCCV